MTKKTCPLTSRAGRKNDQTGLYTGHCTEAECAWWNQLSWPGQPSRGECAVMLLGLHAAMEMQVNPLGRDESVDGAVQRRGRK